MGWRVVIAQNRCKLEYKTGYLVCRGERVQKVFLDEISTLVVENTAVAITGVLLSELVKRKINVVFCDENHNPLSQLNAIYGRYDCSGKIKSQLTWSETLKGDIWALIIKDKIKKQAEHLKDLNNSQSELLNKYIDEVQSADVTNREGHSAKVYFNALFGMDFKRGSQSTLNALLNYGYAIILSAFNREVVSCGYLTQCGLFHHNEFNYYNLSCDLMEPFRILVDRRAVELCGEEITPTVKRELVNILNSRVSFGGTSLSVSDAISAYTKRVFRALEEGNPALFMSYELGV